MTFGGPAFAQVPAENQAALVLRILAFDRKIAERAGDELRVAVIYRPGHDASERLQAEITRSLESAGKRQGVARLKVRVLPLAYSASLESDLIRNQVAAAYVCPGLENELPALSKATRAAGALTFTSVESWARNGLSIALVRRDLKAGIVVNLNSSRAEGADLDAGLLKVAEVIR